MKIEHDIEWNDVDLRFIPIKTRVPLKFGSEVLDSVTCARVCVGVRKVNGVYAQGLGRLPLAFSGYGLQMFLTRSATKQCLILLNLWQRILTLIYALGMLWKSDTSLFSIEYQKS